MKYPKQYNVLMTTPQQCTGVMFHWESNKVFFLELSTLSQKLITNDKYANKFTELFIIWVIYLHTYDIFKVIHEMKTSLHTQRVTNFDLT